MPEPDPTDPDPTDPDPTDPLVAAAAELAVELAATAGEVEAHGVDRARLDRLAAQGLHGVGIPVERGGSGGSAPAVRRVAELLAGADPQVWFVWFQHNPVVAMLTQTENTALADRWLPRLCAGAAYAGVAFSHLRSAAPSVRAERAEGGWRLFGFQPWCTGWGLIEVTLTGALTEDGEVLFALVPAREAPGLAASGDLPLAAMAATHTVALTLDGLFVADDDVALRAPYADWRMVDQARNANVQPSTFGVALAALDRLADRAPGPAATLREQVQATRRAAYALLDTVPTPERIDERLALRADALVLGMQAATALVTSRGGAALGLGDEGQRLLRAATFQLVHAQSQPVREATLRRLG